MVTTVDHDLESVLYWPLAVSMGKPGDNAGVLLGDRYQWRRYGGAGVWPAPGVTPSGGHGAMKGLGGRALFSHNMLALR